MIRILGRGNFTVTKSENTKTCITVRNRDRPKNWTTFLIGETAKYQKLPSYGKYRMYQVSNEMTFSDGPHLELLLAKGKWQGYLGKDNDYFVPTHELITSHSCSCGCHTQTKRKAI